MTLSVLRWVQKVTIDNQLIADIFSKKWVKYLHMWKKSSTFASAFEKSDVLNKGC